MPRTAGQKQKLPLLLKILTERTDEEHPMTLRQLGEILSSEYGVSAERKSLYDDMETLRVLGHDVVTVGGGRNTAYCLGARTFETAEWKLLIDAVQASRLLTEKKSTAIIRKLLSGASVWQREKLYRQVYVANRAAVGGEQVLYAVDALHEAISGNRQITFQYADRDFAGRRRLRHDGKQYTVSPWALCWDDEFYYLIAYDGAAQDIRHFRVDRLVSVKGTDLPRDGEAAFRGFDMGVYSRASFGMFGGKTVPVTLRCAGRLAGIVIDRFGEGLVPRRAGDFFDVTVPVMISPAFLSWVLGFGGEMKILAPEDAAAALQKLAKEALAQYVPDEKETRDGNAR